jgi:hypothetical protein
VTLLRTCPTPAKTPSESDETQAALDLGFPGNRISSQASMSSVKITKLTPPFREFIPNGLLFQLHVHISGKIF